MNELDKVLDDNARAEGARLHFELACIEEDLSEALRRLRHAGRIFGAPASLNPDGIRLNIRTSLDGAVEAVRVVTTNVRDSLEIIELLCPEVCREPHRE